jgi:hypothetical protein
VIPRGLVAGAALLVVCLAAWLAGLIEVLLVPVYIGSVLVPVTILFGLATSVALPRLARAAVPSTAAAVLPFLVWLFTVVWLAMTPRAEGDVLVRAGVGEQWVFYGLLLGGTIAGTVTVVFTMPRPNRAIAARVSLDKEVGTR